MTIAQRAYDQFPENLQSDDLEIYVTALGKMFEYMADLMESGPNGEIGWSALIDIARTPPEALSWLAQFVGVTTVPTLSDAAQRNYILSKPGWKRGSPEGMRIAIQPFLTGEKRVIIAERDTSPYHFSVFTFVNETPNASLVTQAILTQKPAGLFYTYTTTTGGDYAYVAAQYATYATLNTKYLTYQGVADLKEGT